MRKIKWGVLGTAYILERDTAAGMQMAENCELEALAGRNPEKVQAFKERYGFRKGYTSYEELLDDPEVEAVYNPLPNDLHCEWTIKALQKGKHVLCEKPLACNAEEAKRMFAAAKENDRLLMEAFAYQHSPYIKEIKEVIDSGAIGDIRYIEAALITSDYDESNIRMRKDSFGGSTYDVGVYAISFIQRMTGAAPASVRASSVVAENGIDKYTTGVFTYDSGAIANFATGMVLATEKNQAIDRFQIHGTEGAVTGEVFAFNAPGKLKYCIRKTDGNEEIKTVDVPNNYMLEVEQLGKCIEGTETPYVTKEFSLMMAETVDRVLSEIGYSGV